MTRADSRAGVVLAGGYSTRFGDREKALVELDERPLLGHVVERLSNAVDGVVVNCRREQLDDFRPVLRAASVEVAVALDPVDGRGPVAGLRTGMLTVSTPYAALVSCDAPFVDPAFLGYLFERAAGRDGAVPRLDGSLQPTYAVYRTGATREAADAVLSRSDGSLQEVISRLDVAVVSESDVLERTTRRSFTDVNSPADLRAAFEEM